MIHSLKEGILCGEVNELTEVNLYKTKPPFFSFQHLSVIRKLKYLLMGIEKITMYMFKNVENHFVILVGSN